VDDILGENSIEYWSRQMYNESPEVQKALATLKEKYKDNYIFSDISDRICITEFIAEYYALNYNGKSLHLGAIRASLQANYPKEYKILCDFAAKTINHARANRETAQTKNFSAFIQKTWSDYNDIIQKIYSVTLSKGMVFVDSKLYDSQLGFMTEKRMNLWINKLADEYGSSLTQYDIARYHSFLNELKVYSDIVVFSNSNDDLNNNGTSASISQNNSVLNGTSAATSCASACLMPTPEPKVMVKNYSSSDLKGVEGNVFDFGMTTSSAYVDLGYGKAVLVTVNTNSDGKVTSTRIDTKSISGNLTASDYAAAIRAIEEYYNNVNGNGVGDGEGEGVGNGNGNGNGNGDGAGNGTLSQVELDAMILDLRKHLVVMCTASMEEDMSGLPPAVDEELEEYLDYVDIPRKLSKEERLRQAVIKDLQGELKNWIKFNIPDGEMASAYLELFGANGVNCQPEYLEGLLAIFNSGAVTFNATWGEGSVGATVHFSLTPEFHSELVDNIDYYKETYPDDAAFYEDLALGNYLAGLELVNELNAYYQDKKQYLVDYVTWQLNGSKPDDEPKPPKFPERISFMEEMQERIEQRRFNQGHSNGGEDFPDAGAGGLDLGGSSIAGNNTITGGYAGGGDNNEMLGSFDVKRGIYSISALPTSRLPILPDNQPYVLNVSSTSYYNYLIAKFAPTSNSYGLWFTDYYNNCIFVPNPQEGNYGQIVS